MRHSKFAKAPRSMNAAGGGGGGGGFLANFAAKLPFGMSNISNPGVQAGGQQQQSGYQGANTQLQPKNPDGSPQQQVQNQNGNNEPNSDPNANPDPNKGAQGSQLDGFKDIFKLPVDDKGQPVQQPDPFAQPVLPNFDPAKLKEAASKMNFAAGITTEQLTQAMQDPAKLLGLLNSVAQNGFTAALQATTGIVETSFQTNNQRFEQALPDRIRQTQIKQAQSKHPVLSHPAAAPMVAAMKSQIALTNPHLPPDRVAEMAENYFITFAGEINSTNQQQQLANKKPDPTQVDWNALLTPGQ